MTPSGIEPATFRFLAQHLNHCATAAPFLSRDFPENSYAKFCMHALQTEQIGCARSIMKDTLLGEQCLIGCFSDSIGVILLKKVPFNPYLVCH